jgi:hypothetical protein
MLTSVGENKSALGLKLNEAQALLTDLFSFVNLFTLPAGIKSRYLKASQNTVPRIWLKQQQGLGQKLSGINNPQLRN